MSVTDSQRALGVVLGNESVTTTFQPVVDLVTGSVVAYEGLSRGPENSPLKDPTQLFQAARAADRLDELDWLCREMTLSRALSVGIRPPLTLLLNIDPGVLTPAPHSAGPILARAMGGLRVIVELTEYSLLARPATLLRFVERIRHRGWGIAVDDIGAHPESLAMLSIIEPDVVKVDLSALKPLSRADSAALISGVQTYCRRSGARVVAEYLENDDDVDSARALGAHYGQGFRFGRPDRLTAVPSPTAGPMPMINPRPHHPTRRLINLLTRSEPPVHGDRHRIDRISGYLLEHAAEVGPDALIVVCAQNAAFLAPILSSLRHIAEDAAAVCVLGAGVSAVPAPGIRGTHLRPGDPLTSEWIIAIVGLQERIALVASDFGDEYDLGPRRRYDYAITYDPQMVTDVTRALFSRVG